MTHAAAVQRLTEETERCYEVAEKVFNRTFRFPRLRFDLRGGTAGMACYGPWTIRFNLPLFSENEDVFLKRTVPHEVAHMLAKELHSHRVKPHGHEWKSICESIGMQDISRCHSYNTEGHKRRHARPYVYTCGCNNFNMTKTLHRRMQHQGQVRYCNKCKGNLRYVGLSTSVLG